MYKLLEPLDRARLQKFVQTRATFTNIRRKLTLATKSTTLAQWTAIYARVSTARQAREDKVSVRDQVALCKAAAIKSGHNAQFIRSYEDKGRSGTLEEGERPEFGRLMNDVRAGRIGAVFFLSATRLGRDQAIIAGALKTMAKHKVAYTGLKDPELSNPLVRAIVAGTAEWEHQEIKRRTLEPKLKKRNEGYWVVGQPPYGYRLDKTTKTLIQCPNEAIILREIFELAQRGYGRIQICRLLNSKKLLPPEAKIHFKDGRIGRVRLGHLSTEKATMVALSDLGATKEDLQSIKNGLFQWHSSSVAKILHNTMAYGARGGIEFQIEPAPIISETEFNLVQENIASRRATPGPQFAGKWLLTGMLKCSLCGANYVHHESKNAHRYCCGKRRSGGTCRGPNLKMAVADAAVLDQLQSLLDERFRSGDEFKKHLVAQAKHRSHELKRLLSEVRKGMKNCEAERSKHEIQWREGTKQGLTARELVGLVADMKKATVQLDNANARSADLSYQLLELNAGLVVHQKQVSGLVADMLVALKLDESLVKPRTIAEIFIKSARVSNDRKIQLELHDENMVAAHFMRLLTKDELIFQRNARFAGGDA